MIQPEINLLPRNKIHRVNWPDVYWGPEYASNTPLSANYNGWSVNKRGLMAAYDST